MKRLLTIPPRVVTLLQDNHARILKAIMMTLVLITALYTKQYRGEYEAIIHNHIGGILYVFFFSLLFSFVFPHVKWYYAVLIALGVTCILEVIQYLEIPFMVQLTEHRAFALVFGHSYDPVDFIYYTIGAVFSVVFLKMVE
ncbi:MAG TPA: DUF2809 domain-containing protein [Bacteroidales bacterium]|nr:DUF2809 domain-containing protein [Bacteroidales bacterium]